MTDEQGIVADTEGALLIIGRFCKDKTSDIENSIELSDGDIARIVFQDPQAIPSLPNWTINVADGLTITKLKWEHHNCLDISVTNISGGIKILETGQEIGRLNADSIRSSTEVCVSVCKKGACEEPDRSNVGSSCNSRATRFEEGRRGELRRLANALVSLAGIALVLVAILDIIALVTLSNSEGIFQFLCNVNIGAVIIIVLTVLVSLLALIPAKDSRIFKQ